MGARRPRRARRVAIEWLVKVVRSAGIRCPDGTSETLPDGHRVWRMAFRSPGAAGLRIHFSNFDVGKGSVWVYGKDSGNGRQVRLFR